MAAPPEPDEPTSAVRPRSDAGSPNWRRTLYALWIAQTLAIIAFMMRSPFLPFFLGDLGADSTESQALWSGAINAAGMLVMAITAPMWGIVSDRIGRKPMVMRSMIAATITICVMGFAQEPWHLFVLRFIEGGLTGTVTACAALVAASMPKDRIGYGLGLIQTAVFSGASLGPLFGGILAALVGYRATFWVGSLFMLAAGLIVLFLVEERFQPVPRGERKGGFASTIALLAIPMMLTMVIATFVIRGTSIAIQPILPLFVATLPQGALDESTLSGVIIGAAGVTSAGASIFLGRLADRIGYRTILVACAFGGGLVYLPMALATQAWHLIALQALFGLAAGGLVPTANALVANATQPEQRGLVFGLMAGAGSLGAFFGPLAGSGLTAVYGFDAAFIATGVVLIITAIIIFFSMGRADRITPIESTEPVAESR